MNKQDVKNDEHAVPAIAALVPHLTVSPAADAIAFYERAFGATAGYVQRTPDGRVLHADLRLPNGGLFFLCDDFAETPAALGGSAVTIHLELEDVDAAWQRACGAGAEVVQELADQFWGARYGVVRDPFGQRWSLATQKRQVSRSELDEAAAGFGA